ncbi:unnamed protein product [Macrosiphum euphorbiae]|uniref:Uncharacterized protein n=1 Tax=Macrosiphum euphorbiae TaxID=13131 RepID=A0AAV0XM43_9HEMI|nr:unnamed protein product [Macrosiphum euphorbiae]
MDDENISKIPSARRHDCYLNKYIYSPYQIHTVTDEQRCNVAISDGVLVTSKLCSHLMWTVDESPPSRNLSLTGFSTGTKRTDILHTRSCGDSSSNLTGPLSLSEMSKVRKNHP